MTAELYQPKLLNRWTMPDSYFGAEWPEYYSSGFGQSRDSDCLERCDFQFAWEAISKASAPAVEEDAEGGDTHAQIVRENHWAVGWVEWIAIHESDTAALEVADELREAYKQYPVLDEERLSEMESEEADEKWKNCYSSAERIAYIRDHDSQFEFSSWADVRAVVRGDYFNGYASELLY